MVLDFNTTCVFINIYEKNKFYKIQSRLVVFLEADLDVDVTFCAGVQDLSGVEGVALMPGQGSVQTSAAEAGRRAQREEFRRQSRPVPGAMWTSVGEVEQFDLQFTSLMLYGWFMLLSLYLEDEKVSWSTCSLLLTNFDILFLMLCILQFTVFNLITAPALITPLTFYFIFTHLTIFWQVENKFM